MRSLFPKKETEAGRWQVSKGQHLASARTKSPFLRTPTPTAEIRLPQLVHVNCAAGAARVPTRATRLGCEAPLHVPPQLAFIV